MESNSASAGSCRHEALLERRRQIAAREHRGDPAAGKSVAMGGDGRQAGGTGGLDQQAGLAQQEARRLSRLVDNLLDLSRLEAGAAEPHRQLASVEELISAEVGRILSRSLLPVINATGVILHTNLGRAPLPDSVVDEFRRTATQYSNLEYDLEAGTRGKRDVHVERLFQKLLAENASPTQPSAAPI